MDISIHTPARGATVFNPSEPAPFSISIHTPARGATNFAFKHLLLFFISIHTPARGATENVLYYVCFINISIHTPARGATDFRFQVRQHRLHFNPHSRKGSDRLRLRRLLCSLLFQSTLPQGERRIPKCCHCFCVAYFNPHSRKGSDWKAGGAACRVHNFNPHSRKGSDRAGLMLASSQKRFQSTLPQGERPL